MTTFLRHEAVPIRSYDNLGRTIWKCAYCSRRVHQRRHQRGRDVLLWVHTGRRQRVVT